MPKFVLKYNDTRKQSGVGGALYFKEASDSLYSFAIACGTIPSFASDITTYDAFVLTEEYAGETQGQKQLDTQDIPFMWHRDNIRRARMLESMGALDWLIVAPDYSAEQITGPCSARRNDLGDSTLEGVLSITPNAMAPNQIYDCRSLLKPTCKFEKNGVATIVPESIDLEYGDSEVTVNLPLDSGVTVATRILDGMYNVAASPKITLSTWTAGTAENIRITGTNSSGSQTEHYLVEITISEAGKQSWTQTIAVSVPATAEE